MPVGTRVYRTAPGASNRYQKPSFMKAVARWVRFRVRCPSCGRFFSLFAAYAAHRSECGQGYRGPRRRWYA